MKLIKHLIIGKIKLLIDESKSIQNYQTEQLLLFNDKWKDTLAYQSNELTIKWIDLKISIWCSLINITYPIK